MSTDLVRRQEDSWVDVLPAVGDLASKLASTEFVPKPLQGKAASVAACILMGRAVGVDPMVALQHIAVVQGRPVLSAELMRSLILANGHELRFPEMTNTRVVIEGRRRGTEDWTRAAFSMDEAKAAGLAGKDNWRKHPQEMLAARATSRLARLIFADCLGGMSYTADEISDVEATADAFAAPAQPRRTMKRAGVTTPTPPRSPASDAPAATVTVSVDEPPLDDEPVDTDTGEIVDAEVVESEPEQRTEPPHEDVTAAQMKMLGALLRTAGVEGREDALAYVGTVVGRDITSRNELTKAEASQVIDALNALVGDA